MAKSFVVHTSNKGFVRFRKRERAIDFAQKFANKTNRKIEVDSFETFPKAKPGQIDSTQTNERIISPQKIKKSSKMATSPRRKSSRSNNPFDLNFGGF